VLFFTKKDTTQKMATTKMFFSEWAKKEFPHFATQNNMTISAIETVVSFYLNDKNAFVFNRNNGKKLELHDVSMTGTNAVEITIHGSRQDYPNHMYHGLVVDSLLTSLDVFDCFLAKIIDHLAAELDKEQSKL